MTPRVSVLCESGKGRGKGGRGFPESGTAGAKVGG